MGQWEPLADRIPLDMRRFATQLRRMKDRSGLTVPALAARTAQSAEVWERALAGRQLPPLDAVEVLAQASGADYDRIGALWKLAEKAGSGPGDRSAGRPVPRPDPLDPLSAEEGLPRRVRRVLLLATVGALAVAALIGVLLTAGSPAVRAPAGNAEPTGAVTVPAGSGRSGPGADSRGGGLPGTPVPGQGVEDRTGGDTGGGADTGSSTGPADRPSAMGTASPSAPPPASATTRGSGSSGSGADGGAGGPGGSGGGTSAPAGGGVTEPGPGGPTTAPGGTTSAPAPTPTPTPSKLCIGLIVLGICIG